VLTHAFELREDGSIAANGATCTEEVEAPETEAAPPVPPSPPQLAYRDDQRGLWLYHGNCLELLDAIAAKYPDGRFDMIFADPPYFLSNGGITCHAGKMVKVDKGDWDKSRGSELNHEFNLEWLRRCQRVLKPNGSIWVTGTLHVIFSVGYAMQQLGMKMLNDIAWEKPNPPPNLSCRYFTHSTETGLWAAKTEKSKHTFNYDRMREINGGKQMKTVWTMTSPGGAEKALGKHPTQKPLALVERCLLASTNEGDTVLDPFLGGGTTAVACVKVNREFVGIELDFSYLNLATRRLDREIITVWLREFRVQMDISIIIKNDLDLLSYSINGSRSVPDVPDIQTERIWQECKFVFLSCAQVSKASVVHTTVDVSLHEAWINAPTGKKRETTHIVKCQTEIFRLK
jgi:site-specific DNA-methyltransferase (adenine-specific)